MATNEHRALLSAEPDSECGQGCAFVLDAADRGAAAARFCNAPRRPGSAYCPPHHADCYVANGSAAEQRQLREIEALAEAVGGKQGRAAQQPPPRLLRRLDRIARVFSSADRSLNVLAEADHDAPIR
jgi:hypothetical protein